MDDDRDSGPEELQVSSTDLLLEASEIVSLIITSTFSAVIVKFSNFGDCVHIFISYIDDMQVEEACSLHEKDEIYVNVQEDNRIAFVTCY